MGNFQGKLRTLALSACMATTGWAGGAGAQVLVELNFSDARIEAVAAAVGAMVGKNVVVDPKVRGNMRLVSDTPVSPTVALAQLQAALRMHGYAMIDGGDVFKVVPEADAKSHATKVNASVQGSEVQTRVFKLQHDNAAQVLNVVKPLVSPNNVVNVSPSSNALVVTDYADNLGRIGRLIAALDQPAAPELEIVPLEHALASEMVPLLQQLVNGSGRSVGRGVPEEALESTFMADSRSNALIVRAANAAKLQQIRTLVARLDKPSLQADGSAGHLHVVYLKHADAVALAETLRAAIRTLEQSAPAAAAGGGPVPAGASLGAGVVSAASSSASASSDSGGGLSNPGSLQLGQTQMPSVGGLVQADPNTNSLLITAPAPLFRQLRAVIDKLDSPRAQVLVESLIVEVADDKLAEFGVQWQAAWGKNGSTLGAVGTNSSLVGTNLLGLTAAIASQDTASIASALGSVNGGLNLAIAPKALGQYYLGALANFLQSSGTSNILSKPNLLTLDNQEARIIIGENVPFVTGSYASSGTSGTINPFTTVERKDVGVMLRIRPTINENGSIRLTVSQESSAVNPSSLNAPNGLSTYKRSIQSTIVVDDGAMVMLGGLMQDEYMTAQDKVPLLGDVPVLGHLFKSENRSRSKSNLMVFLRPVVLRDGQASAALAHERYATIRALQTETQPQPSLVLDAIAEVPIAEPLSSMTYPVEAALPGAVHSWPVPADPAPLYAPQ